MEIYDTAIVIVISLLLWDWRWAETGSISQQARSLVSPSVGCTDPHPGSLSEGSTKCEKQKHGKHAKYWLTNAKLPRTCILANWIPWRTMYMYLTVHVYRYTCKWSAHIYRYTSDPHIIHLTVSLMKLNCMCCDCWYTTSNKTCWIWLLYFDFFV